MLCIDDLSINNHRCFKSLDLQFKPGINFLVGSNAQGKTSILEAVYMLCTRRSFRTNKLTNIIKTNTNYYSLKASISHQKRTNYIEYTKINSKRDFCLDGFPVTTKLMLDKVPVKLYLTQDLNYIQTPSYRRKIIDWVAYYCFSDFGYHYNQYKKLMLKYNSSLHQNFPITYRETLRSSLCRHATEIDSYRRRSLRFICHHFNTIGDYSIKTTYSKGWSNDFNSYLERDVFLKYGPHVSDVSFFSDNKNILTHSSRGQLKFFLYCLYIAQTLAIKEQKSYDCIHLVDDLFAELDNIYSSRILKKFKQLKMQFLITILPNYQTKYFNNIYISRV